MKLLPTLPLRTSVNLLLVGTVLATLAIVGSGILAVMIPRISGENRTKVAEASTDVAGRVEVFLRNIQARVELAGTLSLQLPSPALRKVLDQAREPMLDAIYVLDADGRLVDASIAGSGAARTDELRGIDLSAYPFFRAALDHRTAIWSDKHLSAVTGVVTLGLAAPIEGGRGVVIAELPLNTLFGISRIARGVGGLDYWIVDGKGEVVADTGPRTAERINVYSLPIVTAGFSGSPAPETMSFGGVEYDVSASYSQMLGWLFVSRIPAGLENPHVHEIVSIVLVGFVGSVLVGLMLAPLWAQGIVRPLKAVADCAHRIASGERPIAWPRGGIGELDKLSSDLGMMAAAIAQREEALQRLNDELEDRVEHRTRQLNRSNIELSNTLATLRQAKDELIQSERLAALGRLVAGVAHELNTPLGNGRMAVTTLSDRLARFEARLADGLRRSELDGLIESVRTATRIADSNLRRASELIGSFKQVAADRTASRRRKFQLDEVIQEVLLTLSPSLKGRPIAVQVDVPHDLWLDGYPGELGQILTNLVENAASHAFDDTRRGTITIAAEAAPQDRVVIALSDDGAGMEPAVARHAFDPFFTTTLGRGGTGLGLFITHNAVTNVLGGTIRLDSRPGDGSRITVNIPVVAPRPPAPSAVAPGTVPAATGEAARLSPGGGTSEPIAPPASAR